MHQKEAIYELFKEFEIFINLINMACIVILKHYIAKSLSH